MSKQTLKIKAWAIFRREGYIKSVLAFEDCSQCGQVSDVIGIFYKKMDAEAFASRFMEDRVIPVEVTLCFERPAKKKTK